MRMWLNSNDFLIKFFRKLNCYLSSCLEASDLRNKILSQLTNYTPYTELSFLDVGANVGQTTLKFHNALSYKLKFVAYCFEPFNENFQDLKKNVSTYKNIYPFKVGMGSSNSVMTVALAPNSQWHSIANQETWLLKNSQTETINITTLDSFLEEKNILQPLILKTDTEGYDLSVLEGAKRLLQNKSIDIIICEVGFKLEDKQHTYFLDVFKYLSNYGYQLYLIEDQVVYHSSTSNVLSLGYANAWFVSPSLKKRA